MIQDQEPRAALQAHVAATLRRRGLMAALTRLLPLSSLALCLWLAPLAFPSLPALPIWVLLPLPALAFWPRPRRLSSRVRTLDRAVGLGGLLCAALEAPAEHPYALALAARARAALAARSRAVRAALFAPARYQRPRGLLVALLAFLLFLHLAGPLPFVGPARGSLPQAALHRPPEEPGPGKGGPGTASREDRQQEGDLAPRSESDPPPAPEAQEAPQTDRPAPPGPTPPALQPGEQEKLALTPLPAGEGPKHLKPVHETEGLLPPPAPARSSQGPDSPEPARDPARLAAELERAAERALGDGLLTPGEAWLARRQAEALAR